MLQDSNSAKKQVIARMKTKIESLNEIERNQFKTDFFSIFRSLDVYEFGQYKTCVFEACETRYNIATDLLTLVRLEEVKDEKQSEAYAIVFAEIEQRLENAIQRLKESNEALVALGGKIDKVARKTETGFKYMQDLFESAESTNESIWEEIENLKEIVFKLNNEIEEKSMKKVSNQNCEQERGV